MAANNVTKPRKSAAIALPVEEGTAMGAALINAGVIAPEGTNIPAPSVVPTLVVTPPTNDAGVNLPTVTTTATLAVPATPVPPTAAQVAAKEMIAGINALWAKAYNARPQAAVAFIEPDKAALKEMRREYAAANTLDLTDEDDLIAAAMAVKAQVDNARNAFLAATSDQGKVDREWLTAQHHEIKGLLDNVTQLIISAGGKVGKSAAAVSTPGAVGKSNRSGIKWQDKAPALIKWAQGLGLDGFYFIDKAAKGYKDIYHALKLHAGREDAWEICTYDPSKSLLPVGTGEFVKAPLYYNDKGLPIATDGGDVPNIGGPMRAFVVPTVNSAGAVVITPLNASVGASATAKHNYIMPDDAADAAGV